MLRKVIQVPYSHNGKSCIMEVEYAVNSDPVTSGFEIVKNLIPDLSICIGYPTMYAHIKEHKGYGFSRYCGFIQIASINNANENVKIVDVPPVMNGIPFFSYGYPAEAYDAPVNNYGIGNEISWTANTFLIDMPSFVNGNTISFLAGFKWGYIERNSEGIRGIEIIPIEVIGKENWMQELSFLKEKCPNWNFV